MFSPFSPAAAHLQRHHQPLVQADVVPVPAAAPVGRNSAAQHRIHAARLAADRAAVEAIKSHLRRSEKKRQLLAEYRDYLQLVISENSGERNQVLVICLIWALDAQEYDLGLRLAEYALRYQMPSPENFTRSLPDVLMETLAEQVLQAEQPENYEVWLLRLHEYVAGLDVTDAVSAKYYRALAVATLPGDPAAALIHAQAAARYGAKVKRLIRKIETITGVQHNDH